MKKISKIVALALVTFSCASDPKPTSKIFAEPSNGARVKAITQPEELGIVSWRRDFDAAVKEARAKNLPLLVLFDEVPGCSTVLGFGKGALSHPFIADTIEAYFIPVAIYNNIPGKDQEILTSFGEPAWNNPIVRIMDADRKEFTERYDGDYQVESFAKTLEKAIEATNRKVPPYLRSLTEASATTEKAIFSMYCFWSGEAALGKIDGVIDTRTGFIDGREAVEVSFDPKRISYESLLKTVYQNNTASFFYALTPEQEATAHRIAGNNVALTSEKLRHSESDDKYQLRHTAWWYVPMSSWQAMRANSLLGDGQNPEEVFSARQRSFYQKISSEKIPNQAPAIGDSFAEALLRADTTIR
jgi:hypothetical protein